MTAETVGDIEQGENCIVIKRIHVVYTLKLGDESKRAAAERAHAKHAKYCPVAQSINGCIDVTTELNIIAS